MEFTLAFWISLVVPFALIALFVYLNDKKLTRVNKRILALSPTRVTPSDVKSLATHLDSSPISNLLHLGPKTDRRYILVGGGGFLGAWIAISLLDRGEDPRRIRLLDLNLPSNPVLQKAMSQGVQFIKVDMTDAEALEAAFEAPWNDSVLIGERQPNITVFHTAANIRFYERHTSLIEKSARVNVIGTQNVIKAAKAAGANVLIYTSSGSVGVRSSRFLLWPWETQPRHFEQVISDDETFFPKTHDEFFSNYADTKWQADLSVRKADKSPSGNSLLRTGCIRPGNAIFGLGDALIEEYLRRRVAPSWVPAIIQSFMYVENCVEAHLCYERRLIELHAGSKNPDIGGQAFCITDPGAPPSYGDIYTVVETLSNGVCRFPYLSPTAMLLLGYLVEFYYTSWNRLVKAGWNVVKILPAVQGDIIFVQPALFSLTQVHLIFDDSRARLAPEKGGLGYKGVWTSIEGACKTYKERKALSIETNSNGVSGMGAKLSWMMDGKTAVVEQVEVNMVELVSPN